MSLKLYSAWNSTASFRVRIALNLKGLEFQYIPVQFNTDKIDDGYLKVNPSGLLPTLVDDDEDIILNQSLAIIEYLDERVPDVFPLIPPHKVARARVRALALDLASDVQPLLNLRVTSYLNDKLGMGEQAKREWNIYWIEKGLTPIEKRLQTTAGQYCFGFDLSIADVCLVPLVYNAKRLDVDLSRYPLIEKIYENCLKLEAVRMAEPLLQPDAP